MKQSDRDKIKRRKAEILISKLEKNISLFQKELENLKKSINSRKEFL